MSICRPRALSCCAHTAQAGARPRHPRLFSCRHRTLYVRPRHPRQLVPSANLCICICGFQSPSVITGLDPVIYVAVMLGTTTLMLCKCANAALTSDQVRGDGSENANEKVSNSHKTRQKLTPLAHFRIEIFQLLRTVEMEPMICRRMSTLATFQSRANAATNANGHQLALIF